MSRYSLFSCNSTFLVPWDLSPTQPSSANRESKRFLTKTSEWWVNKALDHLFTRVLMVNTLYHENSIIYQLKHGKRFIYGVCYLEFQLFTISNMENKINPKCNTIQYNTIKYNTIQYNTIQYNNKYLHFTGFKSTLKLKTLWTQSYWQYSD